MKPEERQREILKRLRALQQELSVDTLSDMFGVTPLTIRRDLSMLQKQGAVVRTHGGCVSVQRAAFESAYIERVRNNFSLKQAIGIAAVKEVQSGETILISDGSTNYHLAANLNGFASLTVYTNSIAMVDELSRNAGIDIHILGGRYSRELHSIQGSLTEHILEMLTFDTVFIGTDGVDREGRCLVNNPSQARITEIMTGRGRRSILLADHTKVGSEGHVAYGTIEKYDLWITTGGMDPAILETFRTMTEVREVNCE